MKNTSVGASARFKYSRPRHESMSLTNPFPELALGGSFDTLLPDFVLAFTFFTALIYAVLSRRFGEQRPAVAMSAALGMALAVGLAWWEHSTGVSIRQLGPIAAGFAIIMPAGILHQAVRGVGGNWAGAGIALGASLLIGWIVGIDWHVDRGAVQSVITVMLTGGVIAFLLHRHGVTRSPTRSWPALDNARHDMSDLYQDERVARNLNHDLRHLKREARHLRKHPDENRREATDIMVQLRRILPAEGWLTERMARLRAKAQLTMRGQIADVLGTEAQISKLPPGARQKAGQDLANGFKARKEWSYLVPDQSTFTSGGKSEGTVLNLAARHK
jgi:hypothetical protein